MRREEFRLIAVNYFYTMPCGKNINLDALGDPAIIRAFGKSGKAGRTGQRYRLRRARGLHELRT
jgi:hypothetical protein